MRSAGILFIGAFFFAPFLGSLFLGLFLGAIGTVCYLKKESLLAEALSHISYPGILFSTLIAHGLFGLSLNSFLIKIFVYLGASAVCIIFMFLWDVLIRKRLGDKDSVICWGIASSMGIGMLFSSLFQDKYPWVNSITQVFLYGQIASLNMKNVIILGVYSVIVCFAILLNRRVLRLFIFDPELASISVSIRGYLVDLSIKFLIILSVVIGLQSGGVVMVSALMVAPAVASRYLSSDLVSMVIVSSLLGALSSILGVLCSLNMNDLLGFDVPPSPLIAMVSCLISVATVVFYWPNGVVFCFFRSFFYRFRCCRENILKLGLSCDGEIFIMGVSARLRISVIRCFFALMHLKWCGYLKWDFSVYGFRLTEVGRKVATKIVRLHRLWEVCLIKFGCIDSNFVHQYADEIEHIKDPYLEKALEDLLNGCDVDPHGRDIPKLEKDCGEE